MADVGRRTREHSRRRAWCCGCGYGCAVGLLVVLVLAPRALDPMARQRPPSICLSNVRQLGVAVLTYSEEWSGALPPACEWCEAVTPYLPERSVFQCPLAHSSGPTDYWLHRRVAGLPISSIARPEGIVMLFEARNWPDGHGGSGAIVFRHRGGAMTGFVDGHAKWCTPDSLPSESWQVVASGSGDAESASESGGPWP